MTEALTCGYSRTADSSLVEVPGTNIAVTGGVGRGVTVTMSFMVADAVAKGWDIALSTPKYTFPGGEFPDATECPNIDMFFCEDPDSTADVGLQMAEWIATVPTGTAQRPRLVVLDNYQGVTNGHEAAMVQCARAVSRLLGDPHTTVVMGVKTFMSATFPPVLSRSIDTVIALGEFSTRQAMLTLHAASRTEDKDALDLLTPDDHLPRGYGVLLAPDRAVPFHTPMVRSVMGND